MSSEKETRYEGRFWARIADNDDQMNCVMAEICQPTTSERSFIKGGRADAGQEPHRRQERETAAITRYLREKKNEAVPSWRLYTKASLFRSHLFLGTFLGHGIDLCPEFSHVTEKLV
jgi:hypothetical protein